MVVPLIERKRDGGAETILRAREDLETNGWIKRLLALALHGHGSPRRR